MIPNPINALKITIYNTKHTKNTKTSFKNRKFLKIWKKIIFIKKNVFIIYQNSIIYNLSILYILKYPVRHDVCCLVEVFCCRGLTDHPLERGLVIPEAHHDIVGSLGAARAKRALRWTTIDRLVSDRTAQGASSPNLSDYGTLRGADTEMINTLLTRTPGAMWSL